MTKGLVGPRPKGPRPYGPQQVIIQPPKGYVPPLRNELLPIGVYDTASGYWVGLPIEALVDALVWAEKQHTLDKVDTRNGEVKVTVPIGTAIGATKTGEIEVPDGEVWYLCEHEICIEQAAGLTAGDLGANFAVSSFPKVDTADKLYYDTADPQVYLTTLGAIVAGGGLAATQAEIVAGNVYDHRLVIAGAIAGPTVVKSDVKRDFRDGDELNTELRLVAGDKLTLQVTVYTAITAGAAVDVYLRIWGRVGKVLVP